MNNELRMKMEESTYNSQFAIRNSQLARRGSALLIVLGMLSFMVVSAVAFSIFMRQGRLPSSFLRQRILARQLVKAGLSHAMSDIDAAIGDDPYPNEYRVPKTGAGGAGEYLGSVYNWPNNSNRNYWRGRVFMGVSGDGYQDDDNNTHLKNTVSTFPLEGLAYIPPPLVNTVRYWARRSPAATWKGLDYDSGRYAFTAVNVSDYLDINRLKANVMRDSTSENRISLGYLFENDAHTGWGALTPKAFDKKMKDLADGEFGRLVSLADYNLALSSDAGGPLAGCGFTSPFCEFIKSPPSGAEFYTDENQAKMQKFITDSWYPGSNTTEIVLSDSEKPVFKSDGKGIRDLPAGLLALMKDGTVSPVWNKIKAYLNIAERAALRDYVDEDDIPTSLALPTIERTPQLVGLMVKPFGFQPKITELEAQTENSYGGDQNKRATKRVWKLEGFQNPQAIMQGAAVFPFKRTSGLSGNTSFPVQVLVKAYLVEEGRAFTKTRVEANDKCAYRPTVGNDWKADCGLGSDAVGFISLFGSGQATVRSGTKENDALVDISSITLNSANAGNFTRPLFGWITVEQKVVQNGVESWVVVPDETHYDTSRFGEVGSGSIVYLNDQGQLTAAGEGSALKWQFFVWVRILDGNGNTVDMFPATMLDDQSYNGLNGDLGPLRVQLGGDAQRLPIVPIAGPAAFKLDQETFLGTAAGHASGDGDPGETLVAYCNDPRFNWAPEDWWFVEGGSGVNANEWFNKTKPYRPADRSDYRQSDLFQFVSNQGYLQSMGEIQFLPLVRRDYNDLTLNNEISGRFFRQGSQYDGVKRTGEGNAANQDVMWKTRWGFGNFADWDKGGDTHDAYRWGVVDGRGGAAVCPYADEDLFMAALANTPYDYIVASEMEQDADKDLEQNIDLCFNARSSEAKLEWDKLKEIAKEMVDRFSSGDSWEEWEDWIDDGGIFGQSISDFHDVDRKFLFSYWKPCFANNQQLFLVFVRAEPTVIGGSSAGHTPSQLGARAVALVWRDPAGIASSSGQGTGSNGQKVHKMRVLFYHQFE